ncbi:hypothetical protein [Nannocystis exedens]|uniref:hypothetical protein n=1 Tax=Nannocystis exedens TaxID=54 RepID=UPI000BB9FD3A|nr:hypothetical protein [Nannocystis exedens]
MSDQTIEKNGNEEQSSRPDESASRSLGTEATSQQRCIRVESLAAPVDTATSPGIALQEAVMTEPLDEVAADLHHGPNADPVHQAIRRHE